MKASEANLLKFLQNSPQLVIPIYQRKYSWTRSECQKLWNDLIVAGSDDNISSHFIGSIVYIEKGIYNVTRQSPLLVIDGQQRLTTVTLILAALCQYLEANNSEALNILNEFTAKKIKNYYLVNYLEEKDAYYKLHLSDVDNDTLKAIISGSEFSDNASVRISENYDYFLSNILNLKGELVELCKGLAKLIIVDTSLDKSQDNPQLIFESMNSTGKELTQADLIRNYILMGQEFNKQVELYNKYWNPMEKDFGQEAYSEYFDKFMKDYLTVKTGTIPVKNEIYKAFKNYLSTKKNKEIKIDKILEDIRKYSHYYCNIALGKENESELKLLFNDIKELKVNVAYPFMIALYEDYTNEIISKADFISICKLIESYVFRRSVCSIPTNSLNKTFAGMRKNIDENHYVESLSRYLLSLISYRQFPTDNEFKSNLMEKDLYHSRICNYFLRKLENNGRKEMVYLSDYTIEHIMPQNKNLSKEWQLSLGTNWEEIHTKYLHTLGNLTLTGYNSEYSDKPFAEKRDMKGGFRNSPIFLNQGIGVLADWNETTIINRAETLSEKAISIWNLPIVKENNIIENKAVKITNAVPSIFTSNPFPELSLQIRTEIFSIDPLITEKVHMYSIHYISESLFAVFVPLKQFVRVQLNMPFPEINDPKQICRDISGLTRSDKGDIEVDFSSKDEVPYILSLIRQAYEYSIETPIEAK